MTRANEDIRKLLAGYVDGELSDAEKTRFEAALAEDAELRAELDEFRRLKEVTSMATYADLPPEVWDGYWASLYRKLERGIGWVLISIGVIVLLCFGLFEGFRSMYVDPLVPLWVKIGATAVAAGGVFLLVSYGRERLFAYRRDRYKEVMR
jgi:hypothetical protein